MKKVSWINNFGKIFQSKNGKNFISIGLAEPVTLKLQRHSKGETFLEEVTLTPEVDEKGFSSVRIMLSEPKEEFRVSERHLFDLSVPPPKQ
jgi:hypothetical protein